MCMDAKYCVCVCCTIQVKHESMTLNAPSKNINSEKGETTIIINSSKEVIEYSTSFFQKGVFYF